MHPSLHGWCLLRMHGSMAFIGCTHALCCACKHDNTPQYADAKRRRGEQTIRSSYVSSRAASFAVRQDERRLAEARTARFAMQVTLLSHTVRM